MTLSPDIFVLPDEGQYIIYAPLRQLLMRTGEAGLRTLAALQNGTFPPHAAPPPIISALHDAGLIDAPTATIPPPPNTMDYHPTRLTLFLTSECNLACGYCYASANTDLLSMPENMAKDAIDTVIHNATQTKRRQAEIGFHGGGEPTMAWPLLQMLTAHAREMAARQNVRVTLGMSTNGCMGPDRALWIANHLDSVSVSADGPPHIQNGQRPLRNGQPSSPHVECCLNLLHEQKFRFAVQATITSRHVHEIEAIVHYLAQYKPEVIKLEPVSNAGRCGNNPDAVPEMRDFATHFNRAYDCAREWGIEIIFSGMRPWGNLTSSFCGAFCEPFNITPDGLVSACYETTAANAPYAQHFIIGKYAPAQRTFSINHERLKTLRNRTVDHMALCQNCFCKYTCGGDCATRSFRAFNTQDLMCTGARCTAIRAITQHRLKRFIEDAEAKAAARPSQEALS